jgi:hypothetical protein
MSGTFIVNIGEFTGVSRGIYLRDQRHAPSILKIKALPMSRTFENPANGHQEQVDGVATVGVIFFGLFYFLYKGLWAHALIWFVVVVLPSAFTGEPFYVMTLPLAAFCYAFPIQHILATRYLSRGWREVPRGESREDELAESTAAVLAGPDPMLPRVPKADTKLCPFCAEEVKAAAIRCKHCQADLAAAA